MNSRKKKSRRFFSKTQTSHRVFLTLALVLPVLGFSQHEFLDFIIDQKNDTIYGTIRNVISKRSVLYEKILNPDNSRIKFRSHKLKKYKKIRFNDEIYTYVTPSNEDGIYAKNISRITPSDSIAKMLGDFINIQKRLPDFVITNTNDTIYGRIKAPVFGKFQLFNSSNIKIEKNKIKAFRFNNEILQLKKNIIINAPFFTKDDAYLKLIFDGKLKLYELDQFYNRELTGKLADKLNLSYSDKYFYIEKGNDLILITGLLYKKKLAEMFSEHQILVSKILNKEYIIDNIYLMVKYYNENE